MFLQIYSRKLISLDIDIRILLSGSCSYTTVSVDLPSPPRRFCSVNIHVTQLPPPQKKNYFSDISETATTQRLHHIAKNNENCTEYRQRKTVSCIRNIVLQLVMCLLIYKHVPTHLE